MYDDWEVERPAPRPLYSSELAVRAKRMTNLKNDRQAVKEAVQPGDSFSWPETVMCDQYVGYTAVIDRFQDEWCYVKFQRPDGSTILKNLGFKRVHKALKLIGRIK